MNIKKIASTFMSLSMLLSYTAVSPVNYVRAENVGYDEMYDEEQETEVSAIFEEDGKTPYLFKEFVIETGGLDIKVPDKLVYRIGEELDLTGGRISGAGTSMLYSDAYPDGIPGACWDDFGSDLTIDHLDTSKFDNTKPGIYKIPLLRSGISSFGKPADIDKTDYDDLYVMVVDGEPTKEDIIKIKDINRTKYSLYGSISITPPAKTVYKAGEKIDLTGCTVSGSGDLRKGYDYDYGEKIDEWSLDSTPVTEDFIDHSLFPTGEPGKYIVNVKVPSYILTDYNIFMNLIDSASFEVTIENGKDITTSTATETAICGNCGKEIPESKAVYGPLGFPVCRECYDNGAYVGTTANFDLLTAATTTTTAAETVKCEYCGKETPKSEAVYGPLGFPVCRECYDNGAYVGTTANFNPPTTTTTTKTVTNTVTTTVSSTSILYTGDQQFELLGVNTYPTKTVFEEGDEFNADGMNVTLRRYIPYEELGFNREDFAPEKEFESEISFSAKDVDIIDKNNKKYSGTEFPTLPTGKYIVQIKGDHRTSNDIRKILGVYITYEIEIKSSSVTTTTQPATSVTTTTAPVTTYPDFGTNRCIPLADVTLITEPTKTVYNIGEKLDLAGIKVRTVGGFGDSVIGVESIELLTDYKKGDSPSLFANDYHFDSSKPGTYTIVLSFYGREETPNASFDVTVVGDDTTDKEVTLSGDANCDKKVDISDSVLIMQSLANPATYKLTGRGRANADCSNNYDGITNADALAVQMYLLRIINELPLKKETGNTQPVVTTAYETTTFPPASQNVVTTAVETTELFYLVTASGAPLDETHLTTAVKVGDVEGVDYPWNWYDDVLRDIKNKKNGVSNTTTSTSAR